MDWTARVRFLGRARHFSLFLRVQTGLAAQSAFMQWAPGALSPEVKQLEHEADHSLPSNNKVKNGGVYMYPCFTTTA
jgi:hypothetical protein